MTSDKILKRAIPSTNEQLPIIGLGTWETFDVGNDKEKRTALKKVLSKSVAAGASVIDSSPMYRSSESVVGQLQAELNIRNSLFLATKVWISGKQQGIDQMKLSFERMKTGMMDLMQVHNLVDVKTQMNTLREQKAQGKIRYTGITHYTVSAYPSLMEGMRNEKPDFVQFNYNIMVREAEESLLPSAADKGIAVIINRPFEEGHLFKMVRGKSLPPWAAEYEIESWSQFFLKYIIAHPAVTVIIPATSQVSHLEDNLQAASGRMPDAAARKKMVEYFRGL